MDILALTVSVISMMGTAAAAVYAGRALERAKAASLIAESALRFQVLLPALFEYRSAEMMAALRSLRSFAKAHPNDLSDAYRLQVELDEQHLASLTGREHLEYLRGTIDFDRRLVSQFYAFLTSVYDEGGMQRKWLYTHWSRSDLQIIPDIIIPMEQALGVVRGNPASPTTLERLIRLYHDSPELPRGKI